MDKINELCKYLSGIVKCENCEYCDTVYLSGYDGAGIFQSGICTENIASKKLVDTHTYRHCVPFSLKLR